MPEDVVVAGTVDTGNVRITRGMALFLLAFGVWSWLLWPTFLRNILGDEQSWSDGAPTAFLWVHVVIAVVSLVLGTVIGVFGLRAYLASRRG
ncbi:SCO4848 family membrane protein [Actinopolyspora lacussalsi]